MGPVGPNTFSPRETAFVAYYVLFSVRHRKLEATCAAFDKVGGVSSCLGSMTLEILKQGESASSSHHLNRAVDSRLRLCPTGLNEKMISCLIVFFCNVRLGRGRTTRSSAHMCVFS